MTHTPFDVKKVVVVWSSVYTTTIRIVSQIPVRHRMPSDSWNRISIATLLFVQRYMNSNGQ